MKTVLRAALICLYFYTLFSHKSHAELTGHTGEGKSFHSIHWDI